MSKTPFELRYELLQLALNTLQSEYYAKFDQIKYLNEILSQDNVTTDKALDLSLPPYPSAESVLKLADQYRGFIDQK